MLFLSFHRMAGHQQKEDACNDGVQIVEEVVRKKPRRLPKQVRASLCPVFVASKDDLLNFDVFLRRIWHENQGWRSGIVKIVLDADAYRELFDPENEGIAWDGDAPGNPFWKDFSRLEVSRVNKQRVEKLDDGLFRVKTEVEVLPRDHRMTVGSFLYEAASAGLVHPVGEEEKSAVEMPHTVFTADKEPSVSCSPDDENALSAEYARNKNFWTSLNQMEVGQSSDTLSYVTQMSHNPISPEEAGKRLQSTEKKREEVSYYQLENDPMFVIECL